MLRLIRFVKNLLHLKSRIAVDRADQLKEGYSLELSNKGPERYITYSDDGRFIDVQADFTLLNDVVLYSD
jgi:hypothetical protein